MVPFPLNDVELPLTDISRSRHYLTLTISGMAKDMPILAKNDSLTHAKFYQNSSTDTKNSEF